MPCPPASRLPELQLSHSPPHGPHLAAVVPDNRDIVAFPCDRRPRQAPRGSGERTLPKSQARKSPSSPRVPASSCFRALSPLHPPTAGSGCGCRASLQAGSTLGSAGAAQPGRGPLGVLRRGFGSIHADRRAPSQAASPMSSRAGLLGYGVTDETTGKQAS